MEIQTQLAGRYEIQVHNCETGQIKDYSFENLITNTGLDTLGVNFGSVTAIACYCQLGTGSTVPVFTDTALVAPLGSLQPYYTYGGSWQNTITPYYAEGWVQFNYAQGAIIGNISEIGMYTSNSTTLFSRALIKDSGGNPTTITLTSIDQLTVKYYLRLYATRTVAGTGTINITYNSVVTPYNYSLEVSPFFAQNVQPESAVNPCYNLSSKYVATSHAFTSATSVKTGPTVSNITVTAENSSSLSTYVLGSYSLTKTIVLSTGLHNHASGVKAVSFGGNNGVDAYSLRYHVVFTPSIPKTNTDTLTLTVKLTWGRYTG